MYYELSKNSGLKYSERLINILFFYVECFTGAVLREKFSLNPISITTMDSLWVSLSYSLVCKLVANLYGGVKVPT